MNKTPAWKIIIAIVYYSLCLLGFEKGVYTGVACLICFATIPTVAENVILGLYYKRYEKLYILVAWAIALSVGFLVYGIRPSDNKNTVTADAVTVNDTVDAYFAAPSVTETVVPETAIPETEELETTEAVGDKFLITPSGGKYHKPSCRFVKDKDCISMTASEAEAEGKSPCGVCLK